MSSDVSFRDSPFQMIHLQWRKHALNIIFTNEYIYYNIFISTKLYVQSTGYVNGHLMYAIGFTDTDMYIFNI